MAVKTKGHTPGPWRVCYIAQPTRDSEARFLIKGPQGNLVAKLWATDDDSEANANLIAGSIPLLQECAEWIAKTHRDFGLQREDILYDLEEYLGSDFPDEAKGVEEAPDDGDPNGTGEELDTESYDGKT